MKIHFIGIGGIGISGLAQYMHYRGHEISGSDISDGVITQKLRKLGITVTVPHDASAITDQDLVIHSAIIRPDNPEVVAAKAKGIEVLARREALLQILNTSKVYAVAGAHGKSTTTAILTSIMEGSAIIGAESKAFGSNVRYEKDNNVMIFEADESDGSFLNSNPYCAIVVNAEPEHMEYYDYNYELFYNSYKTFISSAPCRVLNAEDKFLSTLIGEVDANWLYPSRDITNIEFILINDEPHTRFTLKDLGSFDVWGFGKHIALDAALAILAAYESMEIEEIRKNILNFKGIKKRFDIVGLQKESVIIDDYGHHPTEIKATFESVKEYALLKGFDKITAIWQPHKYSRTIDNLEEFIKCFEGAQELIILPVWSAGEASREIDFKEKFKRYNLTIADNITRANNTITVMKDKEALKILDEGLIIGFGAGDLTYQIRGTA
ncbi:MAG: UDP-N-acetylmuramate--L-alanine ligase [Sulfurimonas sp.]|jgi:UDP-N-acetylmuramate--alanine ligase|uniref:UDP-N-acetylmuramate--L-alanine ligase n=1 Tax=unclassified Sulfurimonas TaxID=2623549 RepID=UPI0008D83777|nr:MULTISPECIES: UDP-N-acetylmuramate--L-alanine ligase [unclassified Sulfurimonas]MBS4068219.1 UDP-N-acetylmuramate--L-alanine ligase [Sulfurimonas sp.]MDD3855706.1 UDP-N-acetylmuramate--L-alanine ligase [Sulfurimonas sp.]MDX9757278.1 UDP-N-acetylmuramate--L-alanine ligase [Sulfurimonas sp.]OHE04257.1 MAG: UDP-N-acetylmuramate--L-alanine ligase [Sulfurimonas sp. RIFOXYB12_FULL_35_9]